MTLFLDAATIKSIGDKLGQNPAESRLSQRCHLLRSASERGGSASRDRSETADLARKHDGSEQAEYKEESGRCGETAGQLSTFTIEATTVREHRYASRTGMVTVKIQNTYEDEHRSEHTVEVPEPTHDMQTWWDEVVFSHTGDGHGTGANANLGSAFDATIVRADDPALVGKSYAWVG